MKFVSTRSGSQDDRSDAVSFETALLSGLAPDGGLYMPTEWPQLDQQTIAGFAGQPFTEVAATIIGAFTGATFCADELTDICQKAFGTFSHPAVVPLVQVGQADWIAELFHGPTLAFKDVAMQVLGEMFERVLARHNRRLTIIGATSGDTGGAAIEALKNRPSIEVIILHPKGRISDVQRRVMTSCDAPNITNLAVDGTFDDCQAIVKTLFADRTFVDDVDLGGINSINWARIMVQCVYYFTTAASLGRTDVSADEACSFVVPTGNFGDIFAGFVAHKMGLPVNLLCAATNQNDIVHRVLASGEYYPGKVAETASPSMDIQVASNFERLIYEMSGRDAGLVTQLMGSLKQSGGFSLPTSLVDAISTIFASGMASEEETASSMAAHLQTMEVSIDPHTAVGRVVAGKLRTEKMAQGMPLNGPVITLGTAHPAKFPESVEAATGHYPGLPPHLNDLHERKEYMQDCANDVSSVSHIIRDIVNG